VGWSITVIVPATPSVTNGIAATREEAEAKFRAAWEKAKAGRRWFLIEHHGKPIGDLSDAWETATALAGLDRPVGHPERVTPHVLRHTCCSW
jgi:integrase